MKNNKPKRYDIDLSATFYPFMASKKAQSLFCVTALLADEVDKELLCTAVNEVMDRFPTYKVRLRKGYSRYYLEENFKPVLVFEWNGRPQTPIDKKVTNGYMFRLSYEGNRVYLEMFHALTDANGAMKLLLATLRRYRELAGVDVLEDCGIVTPREEVPAAELEDSFLENYKKIPLSKLNLKSMAGGAPYRIKGVLSEYYTLSKKTYETAKLLEKAKEMGVSLTAYIAGLVANVMAIQARPRARLARVRRPIAWTKAQRYKQAHVKIDPMRIRKPSPIAKHPIAIMIPVNLRGMFESVTAHNFITFVRLELGERDCYNFEKCVKLCAKQLSEKVNKDDMQSFISTTVRAQRNLRFRLVPLWLKWLLMRFGRLFMKSRQTIIISNLGNIKVPAELDVKELSLYLNVSKNNVHNLGIASTNGVCSLAFTNAIKGGKLPSGFFKALDEKLNKTE